jgi:hypothetical protein
VKTRAPFSSSSSFFLLLKKVIIKSTFPNFPIAMNLFSRKSPCDIHTQRRMVILLILMGFLSLHLAQMQPPANLELCGMIERDALLGCFRTHVDTNHDEMISVEELGNVTESFFFSLCDINHNNSLDLSDWNHPMACCLERSCVFQVCNKCFHLFNWTGI